MADRWALIVAIDDYLDSFLGAVPYAEAGAKSLSDALIPLGFPKARQLLLAGRFATKAAIESRVRKLRKLLKKNDELLVWFDTHAFAHKGRGAFVAWDTLPDDLMDTGVPIADIMRLLLSSKAGSIVCLFDVGVGPKPSTAQPTDVVPYPDGQELARIFDESAQAVCLIATTDEEESQYSNTTKSSLWTQLIIECLQGKHAKAITSDQAITAQSLHRAVEAALPKFIRKHLAEGADQSPQLFGRQYAELTIGDMPALLAAQTGQGVFDAARLKRLSFRSVSPGRVKDLKGFRKTFKLPDHASAASKKFIAKCAADDLRDDLDTMLALIRDRLKYKRKDVEITLATEGFGTLRTEHFDYTVTVVLDATNPTQVLWTREVSQLADVGFLRSAEFEAVFGRLFDQLVFEYGQPIDVNEFVDRLEESPIPGVTLAVTSDHQTCELILQGFSGSAKLERGALTITGRSGQMAGLLDQFLAFFTKVGSRMEPVALPAKT